MSASRLLCIVLLLSGASLLRATLHPPAHICTKLHTGNRSSIHLQAFTYVRKQPERHHPNEFELYLIESEHVYVASFDQSEDHNLKLTLQYESTPWTSKFMVKDPLVSVPPGELVSVYAFNKKTAHKRNKPPGYHLAITSTTAEYLLNQATGRLVGKASNFSRRHPDYALILDPYNKGYALNVDIYGPSEDFVLYEFEYFLHSEVVHDHAVLGEGRAMLQSLNASEEVKHEASYFYLELTANSSEVRIVPHHLRSTFNPSRALFKSLPIGFKISLANVTQHPLYLFDAATGCVAIITGLHWGRLERSVKNNSTFTLPLAVQPFERVLDCRFVLAEDEMPANWSQADARCLALWNFEYHSEENAEWTGESSTANPHRWLLISLYSWILISPFGAVFLCAFMLALAILRCQHRAQRKDRLMCQMKKLVSSVAAIERSKSKSRSMKKSKAKEEEQQSPPLRYVSASSLASVNDDQ